MKDLNQQDIMTVNGGLLPQAAGVAVSAMAGYAGGKNMVDGVVTLPGGIETHLIAEIGALLGMGLWYLGSRSMTGFAIGACVTGATATLAYFGAKA